jgi:hypothetical protein
MIEIKITNEMYRSAKAISDAQGVLKSSIRYGEGNIYGYLGEEIFQNLYDCQRVNTYDCDFLINRFDQDIRVDVKTKMTSYEPKPEYEGSVTKMPKQQDTHIYFFCRVHKDTRMGWAIGWEFSDVFFEKAYLKKKGDKDPSNGMICKRTCWNIYHHQLRKPAALCALIGDNYK